MVQSIRAVIFDMDGLLLDSEPYWETARRAFVETLGHSWTEEDELQQKGRNSHEWAKYIHDNYAAGLELSAIVHGVAQRQMDLYRGKLPLLPGAVDIVPELSQVFPLGLASSSPGEVIDFALTLAGLHSYFSIVVSADEVGRGKPNPDVFLEAARRLNVAPTDTAIFEDSSSGITAAAAAGAFVIAVPNAHYPASPDALQRADLVLPALTAFRLDMLPEA